MMVRVDMARVVVIYKSAVVCCLSLSMRNASCWRPDCGGGSSAIRLALRGVYLERVVLEAMRLTFWEGADLGPARGVQVIAICAHGNQFRAFLGAP